MKSNNKKIKEGFLRKK